MKITIIFAKFPFSERTPVVPPILEYLGALTLCADPAVEVELIDANQTSIDISMLDTDLVAISAMTVSAPWAYSFADICRRRGLPVVIGGIHPTALPEEASGHADSVVIGEAESVWAEVIADARSKRLKPIYVGRRLPLDGLPMPIDGALKGDYRFRAFFTMRGCPHTCTFCSVRRYYGETVRYRPVREVAAEVEARAGRIWFNGDDSIWAGEPDRNIELFNELSLGSKKHWFGFGDLKNVQGPKGKDVLASARKSGLFSVMVGWEAGSFDILRGFNAFNKQGEDRVEAIKRIQDHGIYVILFVILGTRQDSIDTFKETLELADKLNIGVHPFLLMPLPGTELFEEYRPYLLPQLGWDDFTGTRALFSHPDPGMTPDKREEEYHRLRTELFSTKRILKRISDIPLSGFPSTHLLSFLKDFPMRRQIRNAYREWKAYTGR
ncbi:MAG: radical SAM protein [Firmicutes bacterium HGW-Firmicutes-14]|jgi:radical SAM superfamily enzyme YgiQ (UPF0313 family)|nr:MAG: radical SAM protein [Firmicutes bacterium HGW-Firmicutes-14]